MLRIEQHADRDEEQHGKGVAQAAATPRAARWDKLRLAQDHAGEEGAERERDAEQSCGGIGHAQRDGQHGQAEQFAAPGMGDIMQHRRDELLADHQHQTATNSGELAEVDGQSLEQHLGEIGLVAAPRSSAGEPRQQHQHQHHGEVLHHQPADGDTAALGLDQAPVLQEREAAPRCSRPRGHAEHEAAAEGPVEPPADGMPRGVATSACSERAGNQRWREPTGDRSSEKCSPTPNISRMTPTSAS